MYKRALWSQDQDLYMAINMYICMKISGHIFRRKVQEPFSRVSRARKRSRNISVTIVTTLATVSGFCVSSYGVYILVYIRTIYHHKNRTNRMNRVKSCSNKRISLNLTTRAQPWNKSWNYWPKQVAYCQYVHGYKRFRGVLNHNRLECCCLPGPTHKIQKIQQHTDPKLSKRTT